MKNKLALLCLLLLAGTGLLGQNFFQFVQPAEVTLPANAKRTNWEPEASQTVQLTNLEALSTAIANAPMEFTPEARAGRTVISVPQADGTFEKFAVYRVMACEQALYDRHPEIRTFAGFSLRNPAFTLRGSITVRGLRLMLMQPDLNVHYLEPIASGQTEYYRVYDRQNIPKDLTPKGLSRGVAPGADPSPIDQALPPVSTQERGVELTAPLVELKIFRYVAACTHLFAEDQGTGTKPEALAAVVEYSNQMSAIFERDMAIRFQLIAETENVIFVDAASDPYQGTDVLQLVGQNGVVLNGFVGINKYDIGHLYTRYMGGSALGVAGAIGNTCVDGGKANGCSAGFAQANYGDEFVNVIGQEVGHQSGGGHTWNRCGGGDGRNSASAFEPGSGTTIMSYAGSCGSDNSQGFSDLYYNAGSVEEIRLYCTEFFGGQCGTLQTTDNHRPEVTLTYTDGFFIPIGTPFELTGSATDADGDTLSYCWEQHNTGPETPLNMPVGSCPIFRTRLPVATPTRTFPRMSTILNNGFDLSEQLPTYERDLDFRLSARDNRSSNGGIGWADVSFRATALAGPFVVSSPNAGTDTWQVGEYRDVTWDVANTNAAPVNCLKVNIRLSTDGGLTWPITLASGVNNDGHQSVLVPDLPTSKARIRVDAADNIFFDVSNANFKIVTPIQTTITAGLSIDGAFVCLPDVFTTQINTAATGGLTNAISLGLGGLSNLPAGATASLSTNGLLPGQSATLTVDLSNVTTASTFSLEITALVPDVTFISLPLTLTTSTNDFSAFALQQPADGSLGLEQAQTLHWSLGADALSYDVQVATNPSFAPGTIVATEYGTALDSFKIPTLLAKKTAYYWRVRPVNVCSPHPWADPFFFSTIAENCASLAANDLPKNISANNANTIETKINSALSGTVSDVNVSQLKGFHDYFGDLDVRLVSPSGTEVILFKNRCDNFSGSFNFGLDSDAPNAFTCPPPNTGAFSRPTGDLSALVGQEATGNWTLKVKDTESGSGGTLEAFQLDFCTSFTPNPPYLVNNQLLTLPSGTNKLITSDFLLVEDANNSHGQLTYTLVTVPQAGLIDINGIGTLEPGDQFTQADIDGGLLRYFDFGYGTSTDCFRFVVSDGEGGFLGTLSFCAQPLVSGTNEAVAQPDFTLAPNPAYDAVTVSLQRLIPTEAQVLVYSTDGRLVSSQRLPAGQDRLTLNTANWARGMYFTQVVGANGSAAVRKLILR